MKLVALIKKELSRFFHDPRLIITMLIPGILIYVIYSALGGLLNDKNKEYKFTVAVSGESEIVQALETAADGADIELTFEAAEDLETARGKLEKGEITALLVFPDDGALQFYYRSGDEDSLAFYSFADSVLKSCFGYVGVDLSEADEIQKSVMSGLLPFLVVIFIFSACMSITLESVAGEKERGTLATILVTSVKRSHVALGKVIPLSAIAAIGAASSFLGVSLSMPKLMGVSVGSVFSSVGFLGFFLLFLLIISVVPLIVSIVSVLSTYAKSVKEASAYTGVVMILVMVLSLVTAFVSGIGEWVVAIPVINAVVCMQGILTMSLSVWQSLVSVALNLVYTALLVFAISKMLSSERIMFGS